MALAICVAIAQFVDAYDWKVSRANFIVHRLILPFYDEQSCEPYKRSKPKLGLYSFNGEKIDRSIQTSNSRAAHRKDCPLLRMAQSMAKSSIEKMADPRANN